MGFPGCELDRPGDLASARLAAMLVDYYLPTDFPHRVDGAIEVARDAGFDGVFSADVSHGPFLPLQRATQLAPQMTIGTAIAVAFARSPMTLAQTAYDLAAASDGRFLLGLGSQIRPHIVHRFSMEWSAPVPRMREYIGALRAIWHTWQTGERLRFRGDHYTLSLMTPFFDPGPLPGVEIPIYLAGVGKGMARLTGEVADGVHAHPFHTIRYDVHPPDGSIAVGSRLMYPSPPPSCA